MCKVGDAMNFSYLNTIQPCLISVSNINKFNCLTPKTSYGKRVVEHYELDYITWGEGTIITNGVEIPTKKGSLFFRSPGMIVEGIAPYYCYLIVFDMVRNETELNSNKPFISVLEKETRNINNEIGFPMDMNIVNAMYVEDLFSELFKSYIIQSEIYQFVTRTYLMQILLYMYNQWTTKSRFENMRKSLHRNYKCILTIREHIENNSHLGFTLDGLAEMSGLSRYFFCRIFKELIGESPIDYVNRCKINTAKRLLCETEKSIKEILFMCGFDNESHFFKLFKRYVKESPATYRQHNRAWITQGI